MGCGTGPDYTRRMATLSVSDFAQIKSATVEFGDLTVLVGAQGTGKSLLLQWMKAALDGNHIVTALKDAGENPSKAIELVDIIFGVGMQDAWRDGSGVQWDGKAVNPKSLSKRGNGKESVFFIPAHRAMLISDGWAASFQKITAETPVVARLFSENLFRLFTGKEGKNLFPRDKLLKKAYRDLIDRAVFHGGHIALEQDQQHAKRLRLKHGKAHLPFMTWTAGQREFTPLLLGLYHLLPSTQVRKRPDIDYVVIEEPEMGLHPQAVSVVMLLVLDLLWRGYKVVVSTHSPVVLTAVWMLRSLKELNARWQLVCDGFGVGRTAELKKVAQAALDKDYRTFLLEYTEDGRVTSKDISALDPGDADDAVSGWGGLTGFTSKFTEQVAIAVTEQDR